jgi:hypothetical protein
MVYVAILNVVMLSADMLNVVMPSAFLLNVLAPPRKIVEKQTEVLVN